VGPKMLIWGALILGGAQGFRPVAWVPRRGLQSQFRGRPLTARFSAQSPQEAEAAKVLPASPALPLEGTAEGNRLPMLAPSAPPFRPDLGVGREALLTKVIELNKGYDFVRVMENEMTLSAVKRMNEKNADCCLIFKADKPSELAGIFTERDYVRKVVDAQRKTSETPISEVMTPAEFIINARPDMNVGECMALMVQNKIRHVPVMASEGGVVGVISSTDLVRASASWR
jgi:CBS domain-containing protein